MEMQKAQTLANCLAEVTAQKEHIVQRNEDLIKRNMKLELQYDLLQTKEMETQSLLDLVEKEFKILKEEVVARKAIMMKVYTVGKSYETRQEAQESQKPTDFLTCEQQEVILKFQEGFREIKEYLSQTGTYWEELENIRHDYNILYEEHETYKAALEAEISKVAQLEKDASKECASSSKDKEMSEVSKETATCLERTIHQLCKIAKERDHYKKHLKFEQEQRNQLTRELEQLKSKHESISSKHNVLYTNTRDLQVCLTELKDRNKHLELENNGAAHRIAQLQEEIKELRDAAAEKCQCKTLSEEVNHLRNQASEKTAWEQRCKAARRQCQKLEKDIEEYTEKISKFKAEPHNMHDGEKNMHRTELADAGIQVDGMKPSMEEHEVLEKKIEKYKELCKYRMEKIRKLEKKVKELEDSGSALQGPSEVQSTHKIKNKENQEDVSLNRYFSED